MYLLKPNGNLFPSWVCDQEFLCFQFLVHLYNGGPYQLIVCHFFIGICAYMGREWERDTFAKGFFVN